MIKIIRVLRLNRLISFMATSQDFKLSLRLLQSVFLILLYIHISGCIWYFIVKSDKVWQPGQNLPVDFHEIPGVADKFFTTLYSSILALLGNDIYPATLLQYFLAMCMLVIGSVIHASIFGQVASIIHSMSRKQ